MIMYAYINFLFTFGDRFSPKKNTILITLFLLPVTKKIFDPMLA